MTLPCQFDGSMAVPMGVPQDPMTVLLHGNGSLPSWQCKWELDTGMAVCGVKVHGSAMKTYQNILKGRESA